MLSKTKNRSTIQITSSVLILAVALYLGARNVLPRFMNSVLAGKSPRTAIGTVLKKEHIHGSENRSTGTLDGERFLVYYRLDDFHDIAAAERDAVWKAEQRRFAKDGPRKMLVEQPEYQAIQDGGRITIKYAYLPSVLFGVSSDIRIPW